MKNRSFQTLRLLMVAAAVLVTYSGTAEAAYRMKAFNTTDAALEAHPMTVDIDKLPEAFRSGDLRVLGPDGEAVPSQVDDLDRDGTPDELVFLADLPAGGTGVYTLEQGPAPNFVNDLQTPDNFSIIRNSYISLRAIVNNTLGVKVRDRISGKRYIDRFWLSDAMVGIDKHDKKTRVLEKGPVRYIVEQRFLSGDENPRFRVKQRYILYRRDPGFTFQLIFENITNGPQVLRSVNDDQLSQTDMDILKGEEGILLRKQIKKNKIRGIEYFLDSRPNWLQQNPVTGYGMGVVLHSARWVFYNRKISDPPIPDYRGISNMKFLRTFPKLFFGRIIDRPHDYYFRNRQFWRGGPIEIPGGEAEQLGLSFRVYPPGGENQADPLERFATDKKKVLGASTCTGWTTGRC